MKTKDFFNIEHARAYLNNTIIMLKDKPILVYVIEEGKNKNSKFVLKYYEVGAKHKGLKTCNISHPGLDMTPVKLGWVALKDKDSLWTGAYTYRIPNRTWHVGLCTANLTWFHKYEGRKRAAPPLNTGSFMLSKELRDTITGSFLPIEEACELSAVKDDHIPISRSFAIHNENIFYKFIPKSIGKIVNGAAVLTASSTMLREKLEEEMNGYHN